MLESYGFRDVRNRGDEIVADCAFCGGKNKFYLNTAKHVAICFKGCFTGATSALVAIFENCSREDAAEKISEGEDWYSSVRRNLNADALQAKANKRRTIFMLPKLRPMNQTEREYLTGRNVSVEVTERHEAMGCDDLAGLVMAFRDCEEKEARRLVQLRPEMFSYLQNRIFFPIYQDGILLGAEGRSVAGGTPKVLYPQGVNMKETLFLSVDPEPTRWLTLVEGIMDALTLEAWDIPCGATFSSGVSQDQSALLHRFERIYLSYDADKGGDKGTQSAIEHLYEGTSLRSVVLPRGKDPNDCNAYTYFMAFAAAKQITSAHPSVVNKKPAKRGKTFNVGRSRWRG